MDIVRFKSIGKYILLVLLILTIGVVLKNRQEKSQKSLEEYAQTVYQTCATSSHRPSCYEKEIPKLMAYITMEDAFSITRIIQNKDPELVHCHVLAHSLSATEAQRNLTEWKDILASCPFAMCNYGCLHGALIEHFRKEAFIEEDLNLVIPEISTVCEPRENFAPSEADRTMCYHAIGHLAMYITDGRPDRSIPICEAVAKKPDGRDYTRTCIEGAFMTVFQGIDPEELALVASIKPAKENVVEFCRTFGGEKYWAVCRRESYPFFREEIQTPQGMMSFCSYVQDREWLRDCYFAVTSLFTINAFEEPGDPIARVGQFCDGVVKENRGMCLTGIATRLVQLDPMRWINQAVLVCGLADSPPQAEECFDGLASYATFSFDRGSQKQVAYCEKLTERSNVVCPAVWR